MLTFHYAPEGEAAIDNLSHLLLEELQAGKKVLWLLGGGSNIPLSVQAMRVIPPEMQAMLTIALTDERYGDFEHKDSNFRQLREAGFAPGNAKMLPVLRDDLHSLEDTVSAYTTTLGSALADAHTVIAQLGIGPDGHTCGILPHSPAVSANALVSGYDAGQFVRITMTPMAVRHINAALIYAFGDNKKEALTNLQTKDLPLEDEPAQILKELASAHLYSDQVASADQETTIEGASI